MRISDLSCMFAVRREELRARLVPLADCAAGSAAAATRLGLRPVTRSYDVRRIAEVEAMISAVDTLEADPAIRVVLVRTGEHCYEVWRSSQQVNQQVNQQGRQHRQHRDRADGAEHD